MISEHLLEVNLPRIAQYRGQKRVGKRHNRRPPSWSIILAGSLRRRQDHVVIQQNIKHLVRQPSCDPIVRIKSGAS